MQNRKVFAVVNNSAFAFLSYRFLRDAGIPLIGGGFDGNYYGEKGNENIISALGNVAPVEGLTYDNAAKVMKQLGATKMRVGLATARLRRRPRRRRPPRSTPCRRSGLKPVYTNTVAGFRHHRRRSGRAQRSRTPAPTRLYLPLDGNTNLAIVAGPASRTAWR